MAELWHVTLVTHNSRYSERMKKYKVKTGQAFWLEPGDEVKLCRIFRSIVERYSMKVHRLNICGDHVHILLETEDNMLTDTVKTIKSLSSLKYKRSLGLEANEKFHLWAQKFNRQLVDTQDYLETATNYIASNRLKHGLPDNPELEKEIAIVEGK